ncbi:MAG TPA: TldD/PmbA family protein [Clostridia bacterium]|nr:TldD/PmbA family protein [Clostridia bacterium]
MKSIASQILKLTAQKGIKQAEVFGQTSKELTIEIARQEVENLKIAEEQGVGLRIIFENRLGYAYTADLKKESLQVLVEKALANSRLVEAETAWNIAQPNDKYPQLDLFDLEIGQHSLEEKISLAQEVEQAALNYDSRIKQVEKAVYQDADYQLFLYNSYGLEKNYHSAFCGLYSSVISRDQADAQTGFGMDFSLKYADLDPYKVGREAGEKAVRMLGARTISSAKLPVVFEPYVMVGLLGVLEAIFSGEAVLKGTSFLAGKVGEKVAGTAVNLIDHGALKGRLGSAPFDGEGMPTQKTSLIHNGELQGFLHNLYTARKSGTISTGNAVRSGYKSTPEVGVTNFYLEPGKVSPEELLREISYGFYVTEVMGLHTANPISGDFSLGAAGLLIENGEITKPVKGMALAGNLQALLKGIDLIANDLTFYLGQGSPTVRVQGLTLSGI